METFVDAQVGEGQDDKEKEIKVEENSSILETIYFYL